MSESANPRLGALVKLAATVVVAGALVAAMLLPWVGGPGLVARNSASLLDALPVELTDKTPNGNTTVLAADGQVITEFYENNRTPVAPDQISDVMKQAIVDIEDSRFYEHRGLDVEGTTRALMKNLAAGEVLEGGSTLTQQLVKQTLVETAETQEERDAALDETVGRKLREARLALALEEEYSKDEILTRYLNIAYFGRGAYGIQAAAQEYFSMNAVDLQLPQAAVLAGLVQTPRNNPVDYPELAQQRRDQVLARMHQLGHITDQELADVTASPIPVVQGGNPPNGCANATIGGFFCDYLYTYLTGTLGLSPTEINNGGWTIQTTLRPDMQAAGDQAVLNSVPMGDSLAAVYTAVEPGTGKVLAMSANRKYGCDRTADAACESVNLNVVASKGSGSTYKVFTAAAALDAGYGINYRLTTSDPYYSRVFKKNGGTTRGEPYGPIQNVGTLPTNLTMHDALARSSNTYFIAMEDTLGSIRGPASMAQRMGLRSLDDKVDDIIEGEMASFTLGPFETSPLYLASAYSTLAAEGTQCDPTPVVAILDRNGEPVTDDEGRPVVRDDNCTPAAIRPAVANTLADALTADVQSNIGTGTRANVPGHDIAGKTGTSQDRDSVAFVGFLPEYTASVMIFNPKEKQDAGSYGGGRPAQIWHDAMEPILAQGPTREFPPADPAVAAGTKGAGMVPAPPRPQRTESRDDSDDRGRPPSSSSSQPPSSPSAPSQPAPPPETPAAPPAETGGAPTD
ncbi:transglycosylase domain-containing protein [Modestobacter roseus]|uniref:Membrane peptidoglycan carboxypeptidase n=1 Tax=Modestobacter roseus TaxID=1181884 RepID=A0A562IY33_9ACTN|nr:transglycosylase domain-containing protein [Modestobacter roseus]MQA33938.1 penicillin-binding protein [Modestobacter roseus]TWH75484.1 membrane peptidoglycan carboxypeptidase [Modestobacter roseus]